MVRLFIMLVLFIFSTAVRPSTVEVYYSGFWSHSPFPTTIEHLRKTYSLKFSLSKSSIPSEHIKVLTEGFKINRSHSLQVDYVFYLKETREGKLIRELAGGNNILFDLTNNTFKKLNETEKRVLNNYIKDVSCEKSDFITYLNINES